MLLFMLTHMFHCARRYGLGLLDTLNCLCFFCCRNSNEVWIFLSSSCNNPSPGTSYFLRKGASEEEATRN